MTQLNDALLRTAINKTLAASPLSSFVLVHINCKLKLQRKRFSIGVEFLTENAGHENDGPSKLQDMKLQDMKLQDMKLTDQFSRHLQGMKLQDVKMKDQYAGHETAGHENDGPSL